MHTFPDETAGAFHYEDHYDLDRQEDGAVCDSPGQSDCSDDSPLDLSVHSQVSECFLHLAIYMREAGLK